MVNKIVIYLYLIDVFMSQCDGTKPNIDTDCYSQSTSSLNCCYVFYSYGDFNLKKCSVINNSTSTVLIDTLQYNVICKNSINPSSYVNFESCGIEDPSDMSDCSSEVITNKKCCYTYIGGKSYCFALPSSENNKILDSGILFSCKESIIHNTITYLLLILIIIII